MKVIGKTLGMLGWASLLMIAKVQAQESLPLSQLVLGDIASAGVGCSNSTLVIDESQGVLKIGLGMEAKSTAGSRLTRSSCRVAVPYSLPAGYGIAMVNHQVDVALRLSSGTTATVNSEFFVAGFEGEKLSASFQGPFRGVRKLTTVSAGRVFCKSIGILRLQESETMILRGNSRRVSAVKELGNSIALRLVKCEE